MCIVWYLAGSAYRQLQPLSRLHRITPWSKDMFFLEPTQFPEEYAAHIKRGTYRTPIFTVLQGTYLQKSRALTTMLTTVSWTMWNQKTGGIDNNTSVDKLQIIYQLSQFSITK